MKMKIIFCGAVQADIFLDLNCYRYRLGVISVNKLQKIKNQESLHADP